MVAMGRNLDVHKKATAYCLLPTGNCEQPAAFEAGFVNPEIHGRA